ncbi:MAG: helix-turn-helix domain-containing protein [Verrucomicrobia bacterium]|nr:helix-turn-helix domain-containing protein [Verrucomicrobiota bacterium]
MLSKTPAAKTAHTVPVLRKAIRVLEAVAHDSGTATTKGLATTLGISPTTCYRILQSFVAEGWLRSGAAGTFELSFGLVPLLRPLLRHELLIETIRDPLTQLARTTGLTAKLTVRQGDDAVTIHSAHSPKGTAITSRVGSVVSLAIGSSGATFLAALADDEVARILEDAPAEVWRFQKREDVLRRVREARRQGCCFDNGSYQPHIHTLSASLHGHERELVGALTLLGFPQDFDSAVRPALMRELKFTAGGCTQLIAGQTGATAA